MARYLTHMDSPDKAQYDPEGVCEFGGADWRDLCATTSD
ncbi:Rep family protein [Eggerthella lenta]